MPWLHPYLHIHTYIHIGAMEKSIFYFIFCTLYFFQLFCSHDIHLFDPNRCRIRIYLLPGLLSFARSRCQDQFVIWIAVLCYFADESGPHCVYTFRISRFASFFVSNLWLQFGWHFCSWNLLFSLCRSSMVWKVSWICLFLRICVGVWCGGNDGGILILSVWWAKSPGY